MKSIVATAESGYRAELGGFDSGLQITVEKAEHPGKVMDPDDAKETVALLASLHHGVLAMSPDVAGLVQTSTNLATAGRGRITGDWRLAQAESYLSD